MRGSTHLLAGLILCALFLEFFPVGNPLLLIVLVLLGSLLPDVDERKSVLGRRVPVVGWFVKHRTFFHSVFFLVFVLVVLNFFVGPLYLVAFCLSFVLHVLLDALSPMGVKPFWPSQLRLRGFVRVGGFLERVVVVCFVFLFIYLLL